MSARKAEKVRIFDPTVWVDRHGDFLYALAFSRVRDESIAEELVRETLLSAIGNDDAFPETLSERSWLTGLLKNKIIDYFHRLPAPAEAFAADAEMAAYQYLFADRTWQNHWTEDTAPVEWRGAAGEVLQKSDFCELLDHCLNELPRRVVYAFTMREMDGLEGEEICRILHVPAERYRQFLHRARTHLRRCLEFGWFRKIEIKGKFD